jgi:hypothetical protein
MSTYKNSGIFRKNSEHKISVTIQQPAKLALAKLNYYNLLGQLGRSMAKLSELGFMKCAVVEILVSTYNRDGSSNAAPMGATLQDDRHLALNLYNSSTTLANLKSGRCAVVNLTGNIEVYYRATFKEANPDGVLPKEWFEKAAAVNAPKLRLAEAAVEVSLTDLAAEGEEKTRVVFAVEQVHAEQGFPRVYCRAFGLTLEAIVHATRVKLLAADPEEQAHVGELLRKIRDCNDVVDRIAPNSSYSTVMADLVKRVDGWRQK